MTDAHWERAKTALEAVLARRPRDRPAFLKRLLGHEPELLDEVQSLVAAYDSEHVPRNGGPVAFGSVRLRLVGRGRRAEAQ